MIRKNKIASAIIITAIMTTLISCNDVNSSKVSLKETSIEAVKEGKELLKDENYEDALNSFNMGISEDNNNSEALNLYKLTSNFISLKEALDNYDMDSAQELIENLKKNEEFSVMEEEITKCEKTLKSLRRQYSELDPKVAEVENTYSSGDYTKAKSKAENLLQEVKGFSFLEKRLENILSKIENNS